MNTFKRVIAATELLFVLPATLFMTALFVRNLQPAQYEPARSAGRLVDWFADHPFLCLNIFLVALPFTVFVVGSFIVLRSWFNDLKLRQAALETFGTVREHLETLIIAGATLLAAGILAIVALHVITD